MDMARTVILAIPGKVRDDIDGLHRACVNEFGIVQLGRNVSSIYNELFLHKLEHALKCTLLYGYPSINFTDVSDIMHEAYDRAEHELDDESLHEAISNVVCIDHPISAYLEERGYDWLTTNSLMAEFMTDALPSYSDFGHVLKPFHDDCKDLKLLQDVDDVVCLSPTLTTVTVKVL